MSSAALFRLLFGENVSEKTQLVIWRFKATGKIDFTFHTTIESATAEAARADNTEAVYFGNTLRDGVHTNKSGVRLITHLWSDMDFKYFSSEEDARRVLDVFELEPTAVVHSGGGFHVYWKLDAPVEATTQNIVYVESLMARLYFRLGGLDAVQNVSRILRVPESFNAKYKPVCPVRVVQQSEIAYSLETFDSALPLLPTQPSRATEASDRLYSAPTEQEIAELLSFLPPEGWEYSDYNAILMAVHSVFPDEVGVRLIQAWSPALDKRTGEDITATKFASYQGHGVSVGTLYHLAKEHGWKPKKGPRMKLVGGKETATMKPYTAVTPGKADYSLIVRGMGEIQEREIDWLWKGWLARGMVHLLGGHPGDGKSTLTAALAATLSNGDNWPDGSAAPLGKTLFLLAEDPLDTVAVPRLRRHGADPSKVHFIEAVREASGKERLFDLGQHLGALERTIVAQGIDLLVIDPLSSFMTGARRNDEGDVRDMLQPLAKLAERTGVAVLGVMHVGKPSGTQRRASQQLLGSTGFVGLARLVLMVAPVSTDAQDTRRVVAVTKTNIGTRPPGREWDIADGAVSWGGESRDSMESLLSGGGETATRGEAVETFVRDLLAQHGGSMPSADLKEAALAAGFSEKTYRRGLDRLGTESRKGGGAKDAPWFICLPGVPIPTDKVVNPIQHNMTTLASSDSAAENRTSLPGRDDQVVAPQAESAFQQGKGQGGQHVEDLTIFSFPDSNKENQGGVLQGGQHGHLSTPGQVVPDHVVPRVPAGKRPIMLPTRWTPEEEAWERRHSGR